MSSAAKVGEIFTKAGESYNKLGEMIMLLHPTGRELSALEEAVAKQVHSKWGRRTRYPGWVVELQHIRTCGYFPIEQD